MAPGRASWAIVKIMNPFLWIFVAADAVGLVLLLWAMFEAPVGYEDGRGFPAGDEPVPIPVAPAADTVARSEPAPDELAA